MASPSTTATETKPAATTTTTTSGDTNTPYKATLPTANPSASFWHVEPSPLLLGHRSTRNLPEAADVVVVGSGITGTSVAWHLLNEGRGGEAAAAAAGGEGGVRVVMLEAREACWGATGRNGGHCQPILFEHPHDPQIGHFELANYSALQHLISTLQIPCEFNAQTGIRGLYSQLDIQGARDALDVLRNLDPGLAAHMRLVTERDELTALRLGPTADGAVVTDVAARLWPYKLVSFLLERLLTAARRPGEDGSLNLQTHTPVTSISAAAAAAADGKGGWQVTTPRGTVTAAKVVLATNAYTSHLLPGYGDLIVPARGQMAALHPPPALARDHRLLNSYGFIGDGQDDYLIQRAPEPKAGGSEQLLFGGGRSLGLSLGVCDDSTVDERVAAYLRGALGTLLDCSNGQQRGDSVGEQGASWSAQLQASHEWTGIMGFSRDNVPLVGPVPGMRGLFLSAGYTGHGMPNAWLCGKAVASMVEGTLCAGMSTEEAVEAAVKAGLPAAYVLSHQRCTKARECDTVEVQDRLGHHHHAERVAATE